MANEITPKACEDCFKKQLEAQPDIAPSCELKRQVEAIQVLPLARRSEELSPVIAWAADNDCPMVLRQRVIGPVYKEATGRPFFPLQNLRTRLLLPYFTTEAHKNSNYSTGFGAYRTRHAAQLKPGTPR